jgi:hypothetical protein
MIGVELTAKRSSYRALPTPGLTPEAKPVTSGTIAPGVIADGVPRRLASNAMSVPRKSRLSPGLSPDNETVNVTLSPTERLLRLGAFEESETIGSAWHANAQAKNAVRRRAARNMTLMARNLEGDSSGRFRVRDHPAPRLPSKTRIHIGGKTDEQLDSLLNPSAMCAVSAIERKQNSCWWRKNF